MQQDKDIQRVRNKGRNSVLQIEEGGVTMREIHFRAKPCYSGVDAKLWVYGTFEYIAQRRISPVATDNGILEPRQDKGRITDIYDIETEVLCDTVGQFTGCQDKGSRRIYEGDIVRWDKDGRLYVVEFRSGMFYASVEPCNARVYGGFPLWCLCEEEQHCSVVGNRFDNKELLKEE